MWWKFRVSSSNGRERERERVALGEDTHEREGRNNTSRMTRALSSSSCQGGTSRSLRWLPYVARGLREKSHLESTPPPPPPSPTLTSRLRILRQLESSAARESNHPLVVSSVRHHAWRKSFKIYPPPLVKLTLLFFYCLKCVKGTFIMSRSLIDARVRGVVRH